MINLPKPPYAKADPIEWEQWYNSLWQYVTPQYVQSGDENANIGKGETYHGVTALTAGRTLTLPPANNMKNGENIVVQDESGAAGTHNITIAASGTDTINGAASVSISTNYGRLTFYKSGDGTWFSG